MPVIKLKHQHCKGIEVCIEEDGSGSISSELKEICPKCFKVDCDNSTCEGKIIGDFGFIDGQKDIDSRKNYNFSMDVVESIILAHACAGVDITSIEYQKGISTTVDKLVNL